MENSVDPEGAVWSESALFAYAVLSETFLNPKYDCDVIMRNEFLFCRFVNVQMPGNHSQT